jgi:exopolyphosphatase/guanosine-5'-triphosphate,3'-diphosphate pyrophosphatase
MYSVARKQKLIAVVVIGAQNIFLQIADITSRQIIESVHYDIDLGEDIFSERTIHSQTVNEISTALFSVQQLLTDYQVSEIQCYATHSFHEADNGEFVRDQIFERTGFQITWLSQSQEALFRSQATNAYMGDFPEIIAKNAVLIDISSGSVELTAYSSGKFIFSRNLKLGPLRVYEIMRDVKATVTNYVGVLRDYVASQLVDFIRLLPDFGEVHNVILMGSSVSIFEPMIKGDNRTVKLSIEEFKKMYAEVVHGNDQFLVDRYDINEDDVPQVLPVMILVDQLLNHFKVQTLWVAALKLIDGIIVQAVNERVNPKSLALQEEQMLTSAYNLADHYRVNRKHQQFVVNFSRQLFDRLKKIHGMGKKERILLEIAAILDDVGSYVNNHNHTAHSDYIIQNSEVLGLSDVELKMVAAVARYHSSSTPSNELSRFDELPIQQRMTIAKLAAILRLADALDASRQQKIQSIRVSLKDPTKVVIQATANDDIELERWTFERKGEFFESVFGVQPELKGRLKL